MLTYDELAPPGRSDAQRAADWIAFGQAGSSPAIPRTVEWIAAAWRDVEAGLSDAPYSFWLGKDGATAADIEGAPV